jgi:hypothetical protein
MSNPIVVPPFQTMTENQIQLVPKPDEQFVSLQSELDEAQRDLLAAEAELAEEQAAVNAFRMHCRLKLDRWIEELQELQADRQSMLTRIELLRQAEDYGISYDDENPFWLGEEGENDEEDREELLLPTDVPRDKAAEKRLYRQLARRYHPDLGNTSLEIAYRTEMMAAVNTAYTAKDVHALYDLADQLEPNDAIELAAIPSLRNRKIRHQIIRLQQRQRKAKRRLVILRQENTARLWRKAQHLDRDDTHWWEVVRGEIERVILRLNQEVDHLRDQVAHLEPAEEADSIDV